MRHELEKVAEEAGLDVQRFLRDWDSGRFREQILEESRHGWEDLEVPGSPTFVLPSGKQVPNPGAMQVEWAEDHIHIKRKQPAECPNGDCLQVFREMLEKCVSS
jgi:predicted DsbA family dithiol-disulfide isomerase